MILVVKYILGARSLPVASHLCSKNSVSKDRDYRDKSHIWILCTVVIASSCLAHSQKKQSCAQEVAWKEQGSLALRQPSVMWHCCFCILTSSSAQRSVGLGELTLPWQQLRAPCIAPCCRSPNTHRKSAG